MSILDESDGGDFEEIPNESRFKLPMIYKVGIICCLYLCSITTLLIISGPLAMQTFSNFVSISEKNNTIEQTNITDGGYTELRLVEYLDKLELDQQLVIAFEIENHLGSSYNYSYFITGQSGYGVVETLFTGWSIVDDNDSIEITTSTAVFPPPGALGKVMIQLDTGEEADFMTKRYEGANEFIIDPSHGIFDQIWEVSCGTEYDDRLSRIYKVSDGNYLFAGNAQEYNKSQTLVYSDILLIQVDENGNEGWQKLYVRSELESMWDAVITEDGGIIIAGRTFNWDSIGQVYILRVDAEGVKLWDRAWGENESTIARCIAPATNGYILAGYSGPWTSSMQDMYVAKIDDNGDIEWESFFGGDRHDSGHRIIPCIEGGYLIGGYSDSFGQSNLSSTGRLRLIYLVRIDEEGNLIWEKTQGRDSWNEVHDIIQTPDGGFLIIGKSATYDEEDAYVLRLGPNGNKIWERFLVGRVNSCFNFIGTSEAWGGNYILGGYSYEVRYGIGEGLFIEITDDGEVIWQATTEGFSAMESTPNGDIILTRTVDSSRDDVDVKILRYRILRE